MNPPYGGSETSSIQNNFPAILRSAETADLFLVLIMRRLKATGRAAVIIPDGFLFGTGNKTEIKNELITKFNLHTVIRLPASVFAPYTSITTNIIFFDGAERTDKDGNTIGTTKQTWFYRVDMPEGYKHFSKTKPMLLSHLKDLDEWWKDRKELIIDGSPKAKAFTPEEIEKLNFNLDQCGYPKNETEILPPLELIAQYHQKRKKLQDRIDTALSSILEKLGGKQ